MGFDKRNPTCYNGSMKTILVVEDDEYIRDGLVSMLVQEGYAVRDCGTVSEAMAALRESPPDMAVLDVVLPDGNGFELCQAIRRTMSFPILFLTCRDEEVSTIRGFESGGDDYVMKPFRVRELLLRIQSLLRRSADSGGTSGTLAFRDICLDAVGRTVTRGGCAVNLTPNEFKVLHVLMANVGRTVTRQTLLERIWDVDEAFIDDNTLSVHVSALRRKLGTSGMYVRTVRGVGYAMDEREYRQ